MSLGKFASIAPMAAHNQVISVHGKTCFVTCARIIRPTSRANCKPHAHNAGTNSALSRTPGAASHAAHSAAVAAYGASSAIGRSTDAPRARQLVYTFV